MAKIRQHMHYSDTRAELAEHKDAARGAMEDAFWDEDELVDYRPRSKKKGRPRKKGCPGNDGGPHVYVWVTYDPDWFWGQNYEIKRCCGCEKRSSARGSFRRKA